MRLGAISAGVEMSLMSALSQLLMLIAGYAQEVNCRCKDRRNRTHVDHSLTCCRKFKSPLLAERIVDA